MSKFIRLTEDCVINKDHIVYAEKKDDDSCDIHLNSYHWYRDSVEETVITISNGCDNLFFELLFK